VANLLSDVRYCLRGFARQPAFAVVVVTTLALGLGVHAAIFSIYDEVLLRELPVTDPDTLVNLGSPGFKQGSPSCNEGGTCNEIFSYPMFRDLERVDGPFEGIAAHRNVEASLAFEGRTATGGALLVSGSYFPLLGVTPALGRLLDVNDDRVDGEASAVVLSYRYWETAFGADPKVVGRTLVVNGKPLSIVGVGPRGFHGTIVGARPLVFVPITFRWLANPNTFPQHADRKSYWAYLFARLKTGVSRDQAVAAIDVPYRAILNDVDAPLLEGISDQQLAAFRAKTIVLTPGARGQSRIDDDSRAPLTILMISTGLVLLIACVNVANLLLARGSTRVGEIAVRASLGASRFRLLSLLLVETLLLAVTAALVSIPLTLAALYGIRSSLPAVAVSTLDFVLGVGVIFATVGLAAASTLVFGLVPALKLVRSHANPAHQMHGTRQTGGKAAARFRATLTTTQIALSMALLVLAGWFAQSLANVTRVDLGFRAESLAFFSIAPERNGYTPEQSAALFARVEEDLAALPGVTAAAASAVSLLGNNNWGANVSVEGFDATAETDTNVSRNYVSPEFFRTLEMPLLRGEGFERSTSDGPRVAVVNERFVEKFGLGEAAVGKRMAFGATSDFDIEIVGVVRDAKYSDVKSDPPPQVLVPQAQAPFLGAMSFYLRSSLGLPELRSAVTGLLARHDANLPLIDFRTVTEQARENMFLDRFMSTLAAALAVMAAILAGVGIYGVLSYGVVQRLREIGLRMALGAAPRTVRRMVLKQVGWMALIGVVIGISLALLLGQLGRALLFGLAPSDPSIPAVAVLALLAVVAAAAYWPARRAALVDPVTALRGD
jgi:predicted permease